jgi:hypothetical protein
MSFPQSLTPAVRIVRLGKGLNQFFFFLATIIYRAAGSNPT